MTDRAIVALMEQSPISRLDIEVVDSPRGLRLLGDIDSHTAPQLEDALRALKTDSDVTLGMAKVGFIDSTGLRVLVAQHQRSDASGSRLVLANPSGAVSRLLEMTGLAGTLHTTDTSGSGAPA